MEQADWIDDFGPGAGELGGEIVAQGTPAQIKKDPKSLTGAYLSGRDRIEVPERRRPVGKQKLVIVGANANNLKDLTLQIPPGLFVAASPPAPPPTPTPPRTTP